MMDMWRMDAERGRVVVSRERPRARKLAVIVAVQNVLVLACLVVTLYVCWSIQEPADSSGDNVHILFQPLSNIKSNSTVKFNGLRSNKTMHVNDAQDKILISCTGPYILHMYVCYKGSTSGSNGILQFKVNPAQGMEYPDRNFTLPNTTGICTRLHHSTYLMDKDEASLHFYHTGQLKIFNMTLGLSYLLGECDN